MRKVFYLSTCSTNQRILKELGRLPDFEMQEIKSEPLSEKQIDELAKLAGSYEAIFSKNAQKYRAYELNKKVLSEKDFKKYLLEDYTFLKRPVFLVDKEIFVGNAKSTIEKLKERLKEKD